MLKITTLLTFFLYSLTHSSHAQLSTGAIDPTSALNDASVGITAWSNPTNIFGSDNSRATASALIFGDNTNYLVATDFGFSLPVTAVITGITVEVEKRASGLFQQIKDNSVKIVSGGIITGNEHALGGVWPGSDNSFSYGGTTDLWGTSWTPAQINASNFGVAISANLAGFSILPTAHIDNIEITIHYMETLPVELLSFDAACDQNEVSVSWSVESQSSAGSFAVERTTDGIAYKAVTAEIMTETNGSVTSYSCSEPRQLSGIVYYRLKHTGINGEYRYYDPVSAHCLDGPSLTIYPNPAQDDVTVRFDYRTGENYTLLLHAASGAPLRIITDISSDTTIIDRESLEPGLYLVALRENGRLIGMERLVVH